LECSTAANVHIGVNAKRLKTDDSQLFGGNQVAVKVDKDWILAVVLNPTPIKGKIEIEV
jgi:hypothetical protein